MPKYGFLVVEGPHDAELVYRLLSPFGLKRIGQEADLPLFLRPLIPREYPPNGDLQKRMSTPLFLANDNLAIAVYRADGNSRIVPAVQENLAILDRSQIAGMGILLDADKEKVESAKLRYEEVRAGMAALGYPLEMESGAIAPGPPKVGAFVLPENASSGTLEDLLIECATIAYPALLESAGKHVATAESDSSLNDSDLKDFKKPSGRVASMDRRAVPDY